jgi:phosphocarrier protein HPr
MAKATRTVTVANREGFHLRAATLFVCLAQNFNAKVKVFKADRVADGKSTALHLTGLGAFEGDQLLLQAEGDDAEEALDALSALFTTHFGETEDSGNKNNGRRKSTEVAGGNESANA